METVGLILMLAVFGYIAYLWIKKGKEKRPPIGKTVGYPDKEKDEDEGDNDIIKEDNA